jgi:hypothetical protein
MLSQNKTSSPNLVEPGIKNYIGNALQKCHDNRVIIYYWILNASVILFLGLIAAFYFYFSYSKKLSPVEIREKMLRDHEKILNQIRVYREEQDKINQYTDLPVTVSRGEQKDPIREVLMPL